MARHYLMAKEFFVGPDDELQDKLTEAIKEIAEEQSTSEHVIAEQHVVNVELRSTASDHGTAPVEIWVVFYTEHRDL